MPPPVVHTPLLLALPGGASGGQSIQGHLGDGDVAAEADVHVGAGVAAAAVVVAVVVEQVDQARLEARPAGMD